ncbi:hypothetical protein B0H14DRAFT_2569723 [Mycena olivaceomarginata]|nr:hypothetical protein B0H14DRAFT_2569723 [Mycena olivaceomarginata]
MTLLCTPFRRRTVRNQIVSENPHLWSSKRLKLCGPKFCTSIRIPGPKTPLIHTKVFTIDDGQGGLIVYELIGTISHDAEKLHWTSKFLIDNITFSYNDLACGGSLVAQGPGDVIIEPDKTAVLWVYHRSTDIMESQKRLPKLGTTYEDTLQKDLKRLKIPPIVVDTPSPEPPESSDTVNEMIIDSISSPATNAPPQCQDLFFTPDQSPAPPLTGEVSFTETNSQTLCPFWCHGCRAQDPKGDGIFEEVQCERCRKLVAHGMPSFGRGLGR